MDLAEDLSLQQWFPIPAFFPHLSPGHIAFPITAPIPYHGDSGVAEAGEGCFYESAKVGLIIFLSILTIKLPR